MISGLTRKNVQACFNGTTWFADYGEVEFLSRLYDLSSLPSHDTRFPNAEGDVYCHRISFSDWGDNWVFDDARFGLADDTALLRFLAETLHPEVREAGAARKLALELNSHLRRDGFELYEAAKLSGYPVFASRTCAVPGEFPPRLDTLVAGRYFLRDLLGTGGYGCVMRATDQLVNAEVAIKFFDTSDEDVKRFAREVEAMRAISHPNVIRVLDADLTHSPPFLVMPLATSTLETWAEQNRTDKIAVLRRFLHVCEGLQAAHATGLMHRDVKPMNMLVFDDNTVIADFGLVRDVAHEVSKLTRTTTIIGTDEYLAPEQRVRGGSRTTDVRTDVYMLGRSLYELLTGHSPLLIDEQSIDPGAAVIVEKATQESRGRRYASVAELADAVRAYQQSLDPKAKVDVLVRAAVAQAKELLQRNQYRQDNVLQIMRQWLNVQDERTGGELWDEIPDRLMRPMVEVDADLVERCLRRLRRIYDVILDARSWAYAEQVADRMLLLTAPNTPPRVHSEAMRLALLAAVRLRRFAAMDTFNKMLSNIKEDPVATAVAEMLREEREAYATVAQQLQPAQLAIAIRLVREMVMKK